MKLRIKAVEKSTSDLAIDQEWVPRPKEIWTDNDEDHYKEPPLGWMVDRAVPKNASTPNVQLASWIKVNIITHLQKLSSREHISDMLKQHYENDIEAWMTVLKCLREPNSNIKYFGQQMNEDCREWLELLSEENVDLFKLAVALLGWEKYYTIHRGIEVQRSYRRTYRSHQHTT